MSTALAGTSGQGGTMRKQNSRTNGKKQNQKTTPGGGGQGGYNKEGNPLGTNEEQDYEHGKGFPKPDRE
jgi:hypothetical protein